MRDAVHTAFPAARFFNIYARRQSFFKNPKFIFLSLVENLLKNIMRLHFFYFKLRGQKEPDL
jgi:hypothetical protein